MHWEKYCRRTTALYSWERDHHLTWISALYLCKVLPVTQTINTSAMVSLSYPNIHINQKPCSCNVKFFWLHKNLRCSTIMSWSYPNHSTFIKIKSQYVSLFPNLLWQKLLRQKIYQEEKCTNCFLYTWLLKEHTSMSNLFTQKWTLSQNQEYPHNNSLQYCIFFVFLFKLLQWFLVSSASMQVTLFLCISVKSWCQSSYSDMIFFKFQPHYLSLLNLPPLYLNHYYYCQQSSSPFLLHIRKNPL